MRKSTVVLDEQLVIEDYLSGLSTIKTAEKHGCKTHHVSYILKKHSIPRRKQSETSRQFYINHDFFQVIDSEAKAYWLGFIAADGFVTKHNKVGITLHVRDKEHLERFVKDLDSNYPVKEYFFKGYGEGISARVLITSPKMKEDLVKQGIAENKTLFIDFPSLEESLVPHYIRGYFDGDGSWSYYAKENTYQFKVVGTREMLEGIFCHIPYGAGKNLYKRHDDDKNNYYISIGGNIQVLAIMEYLYAESTVHIERKYEKYMHLRTQSH